MKNCFHFNGYKPCDHSDLCEPQCKSFKTKQKPILIIHLGALGAVVRSTGLINAIKQKYPHSPLFWYTEKRCMEILSGHPQIDCLLENTWSNALILEELQFEALFCIDKSLFTGALSHRIKATKKYGFGLDSENAVIDYYNQSSEPLYELGLSNHKKFHVNKKSEIQLMAEAFLDRYAEKHEVLDRCAEKHEVLDRCAEKHEVLDRCAEKHEVLDRCAEKHEVLDKVEYDAKKFDYNLPLTLKELELVQARKKDWSLHFGPLIGLNTGCSSVMPMKKLTVNYWRRLIVTLQQQGFSNITLLGGHEDSIRNQEIANGLNVICSDVSLGLRDGYLSINACDIILTGDSLGMHLAIAAKKQVVAWFGPTCEHEIELFGRGVKLKSSMGCSPCWKRQCDKEQMCYDSIFIQDWINAVHQLLKTRTHLINSVDFSGPESESPLN